MYRLGQTEKLIGKKITLTPLSVEMFTALVERKNYQALSTGGEWPTAVIKDIIQKDIAIYKKYPELLIWSVWVISNSEGRIVGDIGFKGPPDGNGVVELGYQILYGHRQKGYVTESIQMICDFAFFKGVEKIEAEIHVKNYISQHVIQKNGFKEILAKENYKYYEKLHDNMG